MHNNFGSRDASIKFAVLFKSSFGGNFVELHHAETKEACIEFIIADRVSNSGEYVIKNRKGEIV